MTTRVTVLDRVPGIADPGGGWRWNATPRSAGARAGAAGGVHGEVQVADPRHRHHVGHFRRAGIARTITGIAHVDPDLQQLACPIRQHATGAHIALTRGSASHSPKGSRRWRSADGGRGVDPPAWLSGHAGTRARLSVLLRCEPASRLVAVSLGARRRQCHRTSASRQPREKSADRLAHHRFTISRAHDAPGVHQRSRRGC